MWICREIVKQTYKLDGMQWFVHFYARIKAAKFVSKSITSTFTSGRRRGKFKEIIT